MNQLKNLDIYEIAILKSETVTDGKITYSGLQIFKRLDENKSFMSERNYNYMYNLACTNASLERIFKNTEL